MIKIVCAGLFFCGLVNGVSSLVLAQSTATVSINGSQRYQVIDGFGVNANSASWNDGELRPAIDSLVDQLGANIWRVVIENGDWESTNDNADPAVMNWTYYNTVYSSPKFEKLWGTIAYLNQKGISDNLILSVMGPIAGWMGGSQLNSTSEDEWVEMVASLIYYGRVTRGLRIPMFSPLNETDHDGIEGPQLDAIEYVRVMRKLSQRLDGLGLSDVRLLGPETANISSGVNTFMPGMIADATVLAKVDHFALHNYDGDSGGADAAIKASAPTKNFWITEVTNINDIVSHVSQGPGAVLVWDAYDSVYNHAILAGRGTTPPNDVGDGPPLMAYNTTTGVYTPRKGFYECAQLFRFVRPGFRRIGASSFSSSIVLLAFLEESTGRVTIVGRNTSTFGRTISVTLANLAGVSRLEFYQTTSTANLQRGSDVSVANNAFSVQVAGSSVFTLTSPVVADTASPTVSMSEPMDGSVVSGVARLAATASDDVAVAGVQFLLDGMPVGAEDTSAPFEIQWSSGSTLDGLHQIAARARDTAGHVTLSAAVSVTVDNRDFSPPSVVRTVPASGATGVAPAATISATFNEALNPASVSSATATLQSESQQVATTVSYANNTVTLTPNSALINGQTYTVTLVGGADGLSDVAGNRLPSSVSWSFTIAPATNCPCSLWTSSAAGPMAFDGGAVELGVKFRSDIDGYIRDIRFYKYSQNSGTHTGNLWTVNGTRLATVTFANETSSGWQRATFSSPVPISAGVTYVASYHTNAGYYASSANGFFSARDAGPLEAPSSSSVGGNGVYRYGLSAFPNQTYQATNYWVDVVFVTTNGADTTSPTVSVSTPSSGAVVSGTVTMTASASDAVGVVGVQFLVDGSAVGAEDTTAPYSAIWNTAGVANGPHIIAARARDAAGNVTTSSSVSVTVNNVDATAPTVTVTSPSAGTTVEGTLTLTASASDNVSVAGVQFYVDGTAVGTEDTSAPYSSSWSTVSVPNGSHTLSAVARDAAGNATTSAGVQVTVSNLSVPPPQGLVAAYGFEEGTGVSTTDESGSGLTGTIANAAWTASGRFGRALSFNGATSIVTIADSPLLDLTIGMTLEAWVSPATASNWQSVLMKETSQGLAFALYGSEPTGRAAAFVRIGEDVEAGGTSNIPVNTWTHLAATFDGASLRFYVNGSLVRTVARSGAIQTSSSPLRIGGNTIWGEYFRGLIDEVRIYNRALSATEIQVDMNTPVSGGQ